MKKASKVLSLLICLCLLISVLSSLTVVASGNNTGSTSASDGSPADTVEATAMPPVYISPAPVPTDWTPPTIPPYGTVIPLDQNVSENVLQIGDVGSVSFTDYFNGSSWHYTIKDSSVIQLDSSITLPLFSSAVQPDFAAPTQLYNTTWYFKALQQGSTVITFYQDNIYAFTNSMPAFNAISFVIRVGDPLPPTPTPEPTPVPPPPPTPQNFIPLNALSLNILSVGSVGYVKQEYNSNYVWSFKIEDPSIIDSYKYAIMSDGTAVPAIYPYPGPWLFMALKEGETTITFTGNPSNPLMEIPSQIVTYKVKVTSSGEVTIKPSVPPEPTPVPTPPQKYIPLELSAVNVLSVGSIGVVKRDNYSYIWSFDIGDRTVIDCEQIMPMGFGTAVVGSDLGASILPFRGPWFFTALQEGETTITFTGNPSDPEMKVSSIVQVYKVKVTASGDTTVEPAPTDGPLITPEPKPEPVFNDSTGYEWAMDAVTNLSACGVVNGYEDGSFKPGNNVTRAEFAKMLVMTFGIYDPNAVSSFNDVASDTWFNSYVASAEQAGLAKGVGDNSFAPCSTITREEMFTFCARAVEKYKGYNVLDKASPEVATQVNSFVDGNQVDDWATPYVATVTKCGLVTGSPSAAGTGNEINPKANITRAEVAVVLNRALQMK